MSTIVLTSKGAKFMRVCEANDLASIDDLIKLRADRSACLAVCMTEGCDFIISMKPTEQEGKCPACGGNTMVSVLVLAGIA